MQDVYYKIVTLPNPMRSYLLNFAYQVKQKILIHNYLQIVVEQILKYFIFRKMESLI